VLAAFQTHRLVGLGESHGLQNHGDALALLLSDPRLPGVVDDIVVEFGNALYQDTVDAFIAGQPVNDADLCAVWRNTTSSPSEPGTAPPASRRDSCLMRPGLGNPASVLKPGGVRIRRQVGMSVHGVVSNRCSKIANSRRSARIGRQASGVGADGDLDGSS
jgi:hypothetical protein